MPSHSPPLALNHCWDNEGNPPHPTTTILLPLPDPQTDTSFIEILWCSNPQLPPGAIMDSLRQPFPARLSSKPAWVTSPPLLLEKKVPQQCHSCHIQLIYRPFKLQCNRPEEHIHVKSCAYLYIVKYV